jgi:LemA protein
MSTLAWIALGVVAVAFFWSVGAHNRVMALRQAITAAFLEFDTHLKERADLCDKLLAAVTPHLPNEQATFDALNNAQAEALRAAQAARSRPWSPEPVGALAVATALQASALTRLTSLLDHQTELRNEAGIDALLDELKLIERQRAFTRQLFNQAVGRYNEACQQFPTRLLARVQGFTEARTL